MGYLLTTRAVANATDLDVDAVAEDGEGLLFLRFVSRDLFGSHGGDVVLGDQ